MTIDDFVKQCTKENQINTQSIQGANNFFQKYRGHLNKVTLKSDSPELKPLQKAKMKP